MNSTPATVEQPVRCGCEEGNGLSRRGLLKGLGLSGALGTAFTLSPNGSRYALAAPGTATDTLVVLSLRGGFDGLSAVAPVGDPAYASLRGSSAVPAAQALQLDATFGLHPSLAPLKPYWDNGTMAVAVDVGQPAGTRSHFDAMAELERAAPGSTERTGWLDRLVGLAPSDNVFTAAQIGSGAAPASFIGPQGEMTIGRINDFRLAGAGDPSSLARWGKALRDMHSGGNAMVSVPVLRAIDALTTVNGIKTSDPEYKAPAAYPRDGSGALVQLSQALNDTARLMKAGVGLRVVNIDCGNWDMHEGAGVNGGWMKDQLAQVAQALAAFAADLGPLFDSTTLITLSEFGRRVQGNGTGGFDHGHGNQVLMLGGGLRGTRVHGSWGGLGAANLVQGDLPGRNDYRSVLGSILTQRMGVSTAQLASVFPNPPAGLIDVARPR